MFDRAVGLRAKGWTASAIALEAGVNRKTICEWLVSKRPGLWQRSSLHPADEFDAYVRGRWDEGSRNATQLFREVGEMGYDWRCARLRALGQDPAA